VLCSRGVKAGMARVWSLVKHMSYLSVLKVQLTLYKSTVIPVVGRRRWTDLQYSALSSDSLTSCGNIRRVYSCSYTCHQTILVYHLVPDMRPSIMSYSKLSRRTTWPKYTSLRVIRRVIAFSVHIYQDSIINTYRVGQLKWGQLTFLMVIFECIVNIQWFLAHVNYIQQEVVWCNF